MVSERRQNGFRILFIALEGLISLALSGCMNLEIITPGGSSTHSTTSLTQQIFSFSWLGEAITAPNDWTTSGTVFAGSLSGTFDSPEGVAVDPAGGYFYVADSQNSRIEKFNLSTGAFVGAIGGLIGSTGTCPVTGAASGWCTGGLFSPGTASGEFGNVYYTDNLRLAIDPTHGLLYVSDGGNDRVEKFALSTGAFEGSLGASVGGIYSSKYLNNPQVFSVAAWFKTTATLGGKIAGFGDNGGGFGNSDNYDRQIYMDDSGHLYFGICSAVCPVTVNSAASYNDGSWHHVVGTYTANSMILYVDGAEVASTTVDVPYAQEFAGFWNIGNDTLTGWPGSWTTTAFQGEIEDVAVWNSVLSAGDVSTIYSSASPLGPSFSAMVQYRIRLASERDERYQLCRRLG